MISTACLLSKDSLPVYTTPFIHEGLVTHSKCIEREEAFKLAQAATSTGYHHAQAKDLLLNGRPFEAIGPPITIYEPIFSTFCVMNEGKLPVDISPEDYDSVGDFLVASASIYPDRKTRQAAVSGALQNLLGMP
jgi:hypothetical protein